MSNPWPMVPLGEVASPIERPVAPIPGTTYRQIGVRLWGGGAYERESIDGGQTKYKTLSRMEADDIIVNKIWARSGSVAVVQESLSGCFGSGELPTFEPDKAKLHPQWVHWLTKTRGFWGQCDEKSRGTSGKNRIRPERFLEVEIPLPPLPEQRRIVARIEQLAAKIKEVRNLRSRAAAETGVLSGSHLGETFKELAKKHTVYSLGELCSHIVDGPHVTPAYLPDGVPGIPFVTVKNMVSGKLDFTDAKNISENDHREFTRRCRPEYGDVLYSKDGATRGRPCFIDIGRTFSYFVSVALIKPRRDRLDGRYAVHLLNSTWIKDRMADKSRGDMIPHIVLREIRAFPVPRPPLQEQRRIVEELDAMQSKVNALKRMQTDATAELEALLPSILDTAFKGEL